MSNGAQTKVDLRAVNQYSPLGFACVLGSLLYSTLLYALSQLILTMSRVSTSSPGSTINISVTEGGHTGVVSANPHEKGTYIRFHRDDTALHTFNTSQGKQSDVASFPIPSTSKIIIYTTPDDTHTLVSGGFVLYRQADTGSKFIDGRECGSVASLTGEEHEEFEEGKDRDSQK